MRRLAQLRIPHRIGAKVDRVQTLVDRNQKGQGYHSIFHVGMCVYVCGVCVCVCVRVCVCMRAHRAVLSFFRAQRKYISDWLVHPLRRNLDSV